MSTALLLKSKLFIAWEFIPRYKSETPGERMAKKQHPNSLGIHRRKDLLRICTALRIEGAAMWSNRDIIYALADARKIDIGAAHQQNADIVLAWFALHEPGTLVRTSKKVHVNSLPAFRRKDNFYRSWEWRTLRMEVLREFGAACQCCGAKRGDLAMDGQPVRICVDHIKPLAKHWELRLERSNLQVLCDECNQGKGAWDETDYRAVEASRGLPN